MFHYSKLSQDFPGDTVARNLPASAGDTGMIPGPGRFHMPHGATKPMQHEYWAHALQLLKPLHLEPVLCNREPAAMRRPAKSSLHSLQLEKAREQQQRPIATKNK